MADIDYKSVEVLANEFFKPKFQAGDTAYFVNGLGHIEKVKVKKWVGGYENGRILCSYHINGKYNERTNDQLFATALEACEYLEKVS